MRASPARLGGKPGGSPWPADRPPRTSEGRAKTFQPFAQHRRHLCRRLANASLPSPPRPRPAPVRGSSAAGCGRGWLRSHLSAPMLTISMLPLKYGSSSIMMRAVLISPTSLASLRISMRVGGFHVSLHRALGHDFAGFYPGVHRCRSALWSAYVPSARWCLPSRHRHRDLHGYKSGRRF